MDSWSTRCPLSGLIVNYPTIERDGCDYILALHSAHMCCAFQHEGRSLVPWFLS